MDNIKQFNNMVKRQKKLLKKKNTINNNFYNGVFTRYKNPILTNEHVPISWRYDLNNDVNPYYIERLGINAVFNSGAIFLNNYFYLVARVEGTDRKSFFAICRSKNGIDNFEFVEPVAYDDLTTDETNVYDMRLVKHEDGYIYGIYCSECKDMSINDTSSAIAKVGILRTKDLHNWERLPNLKFNGSQQRNCVLHPEFVDGKYAIYTRPQDGFITVGAGGGIGFGYIRDMNNPILEDEIIIDELKYHTIYELKNGEGPAPIKTSRGWIHFAHGVRNTAAGLRYVLYSYATSLDEPWKVIAKPSGYLLAPIECERVGDVSNVLFTNGVILHNDMVYLYYASSDTRMHVATAKLDVLLDYIFNNPKEEYRSIECVKQRIELIERNKRI